MSGDGSKEVVAMGGKSDARIKGPRSDENDPRDPCMDVSALAASTSCVVVISLILEWL